MEDKNNSEHSDDGHSHYKRENKFNKCETLDEGTFAFMPWVSNLAGVGELTIPNI